jgi:hypothetical protein
VHDPQAIRTVVVSGLPTTIDSKTLWKKIRKYDGAQKVEWPVKAENGEEDQSTGMLHVHPTRSISTHRYFQPTYYSRHRRQLKKP